MTQAGALAFNRDRLRAWWSELLAFRRGMSPGLRHIPRVRAAQRIEDRWRLDEALAAWDRIRAALPRYEHGFDAYARVLSKLNRDRDALAAVDEALARFPASAELAVLKARFLNKTGDFEASLAVSRALMARRPDLPVAAEMVAKALRHQRQFDQSDEILRAAVPRFPADLGLAVEYAVTAEVRGDWAAAVERSRALVRAFPRAPLAHACLGGALKKMMRFDEAEAVFSAARARFPGDSNIAINWAWVADDQGHWEEALRRWENVQARFPHNPRVRECYRESQGRAALHRIDAAVEQGHAAPPPVAAPSGGSVEQDAESTALVSRFEGLGTDCEFGFMQRHFGAEPMGLLRWAGIDYERLMVGLDTDFAGVGGTERTRLNVNPANSEYYTTDTFYGMSMHTFVLRKETGEEALYVKMCRRLSFLRERLLDELRTGEKIFVFKDERVSDEAARRLHEALRRHGSGALLVVRAAEAGERPGAISMLDDGLAVALLDQVGFRNEHWNISFNLWLDICRDAASLFEPTPDAAGPGASAAQA